MADAQLTCSRADDFVIVSRPKKGTAFVEARLNDGYNYTDKGWQQILAHLERELSPDKLNDDAVISLETDLTNTPLSKHVPQGIFQSLRVVDIQGLDPATRQISARDVAIKFNPYKFGSEAFDRNKASVLPIAAIDGLWELLPTDDTRSRLSRWVMGTGASRLEHAPAMPFPSKPGNSVIFVLGLKEHGNTGIAFILAHKISIHL
ncbi:hypothetical protein CGCTS75_v002316 [Colletotrichum tropicale]|nr:hypothetical protein CGCTS75_v002316 [Colletotrichum tropicale]